MPYHFILICIAGTVFPRIIISDFALFYDLLYLFRKFTFYAIVYILIIIWTIS